MSRNGQTLFQEVTHLTRRQSSMRASNNRKQLKNGLIHVHIYIELTSDYILLLHIFDLRQKTGKRLTEALTPRLNLRTHIQGLNKI